MKIEFENVVGIGGGGGSGMFGQWEPSTGRSTSGVQGIDIQVVSYFYDYNFEFIELHLKPYRWVYYWPPIVSTDRWYNEQAHTS